MQSLRAFTVAMQATIARPPAPASLSVLRTSRGSRQIMASAAKEALVARIQETNAKNPVVAYVTSYCPYCHEVRRLFKELKVDATIVDFDAAADGKELRAALNETFGVHTVPQVFVGNKRIGGCDDTLAAYQSGKLKTSLAEVGIKI